MFKRILTKFSKESPYNILGEYELPFEPKDVAHLFNLEEDPDMRGLFFIETLDQQLFFRGLGLPVYCDLADWYVESYNI